MGYRTRSPLPGLADSCGRPRCLPSVRVSGSMCTHDPSPQRRSTASRESSSTPDLPRHTITSSPGSRTCPARWP
ncbi:hypothetical protein ACFFX0_30620 [Citricoccus parietis]|uniref:Uncharacterized protein n=1 Tax=Citricoccus parietis TaxID=592307 RepID=A0ABV5G8K4_9MICC